MWKHENALLRFFEKYHITMQFMQKMQNAIIHLCEKCKKFVQFLTKKQEIVKNFHFSRDFSRFFTFIVLCENFSCYVKKARNKICENWEMWKMQEIMQKEKYYFLWLITCEKYGRKLRNVIIIAHANTYERFGNAAL